MQTLLLFTFNFVLFCNKVFVIPYCMAGHTAGDPLQCYGVICLL